MRGSWALGAPIAQVSRCLESPSREHHMVQGPTHVRIMSARHPNCTSVKCAWGSHSCKHYGCSGPHSCEGCGCPGPQLHKCPGAWGPPRVSITGIQGLTHAMFVSVWDPNNTSVMGALGLTRASDRCFCASTCLPLPRNYPLFPLPLPGYQPGKFGELWFRGNGKLP